MTKADVLFVNRLRQTRLPRWQTTGQDNLGRLFTKIQTASPSTRFILALRHNLEVQAFIQWEVVGPLPVTGFMDPGLFGFLSTFDNAFLSSKSSHRAIIDGVQRWNRMHGTHLEPYTVWHDYCREKFSVLA